MVKKAQHRSTAFSKGMVKKAWMEWEDGIGMMRMPPRWKFPLLQREE
jgi:hypothetical protein